MPTSSEPVSLRWPGRSPVALPQPGLALQARSGAATHPESLIVQGEHLAVLSALLPSLEGQVDLVYVDPPFDTGRAFRDTDGREAYSDRTGPGQWLTALEGLLVLVRRILSPEGSLILHCDHRRAHHAAVLCDELFGAGARGTDPRSPGFRNELVWCYGLGGSSPRYYPRKHDTLLWYTKGRAWHFEAPRVAARSRRMAGKTKKVPDWWDLPSLNNMAAERTGYPTQKPLALLERIIRAHTRPGARVLDPCCGSGTTPVAAHRLGRSFVGIDQGALAVETTLERLAAEGCVPRVQEAHTASEEPSALP